MWGPLEQKKNPNGLSNNAKYCKKSKSPSQGKLSLNVRTGIQPRGASFPLAQL